MLTHKTEIQSVQWSIERGFAMVSVRRVSGIWDEENKKWAQAPQLTGEVFNAAQAGDVARIKELAGESSAKLLIAVDAANARAEAATKARNEALTEKKKAEIATAAAEAKASRFEAIATDMAARADRLEEERQRLAAQLAAVVKRETVAADGA